MVRPPEKDMSGMWGLWRMLGTVMVVRVGRGSDGYRLALALLSIRLSSLDAISAVLGTGVKMV